MPFSVKGEIAGVEREFRANGFLEIPSLDSESGSNPCEARASSARAITSWSGSRRANVRNFYGAEIEVRFDSSALELVGGPLGVDKGRVFVEEAEGQAKVLSWQTPQVVEGPDGTVMVRIRGQRAGASEPVLRLVSDTLATLRLKALKPGDHAIQFGRVRVYDQDGQEVRVMPAHGQVRVVQ